MASADITGIINTSASGYQLPSVGSAKQLGKDDFLKLLVAQMTHQDPLEPQTNDQFITQMAQLSSYEQIQNLNDQFKINAGLMTITTGSSMIGKQVTYADTETKADVTGLVDKVEMGDGEFVLSIGGKKVPLSQVKTIADAPPKTA